MERPQDYKETEMGPDKPILQTYQTSDQPNTTAWP